MDATRSEASGAEPGYRFFSNTACEFYPCHDMGGEPLNCLFCYCPLYCLGDACGGNPRWVGDDGDIKDCSACTLPHRAAGYDHIMRRFERVKDVAVQHRGAE